MVFPDLNYFQKSHRLKSLNSILAVFHETFQAFLGQISTFQDEYKRSLQKIQALNAKKVTETTNSKEPHKCKHHLFQAKSTSFLVFLSPF